MCFFVFCEPLNKLLKLQEEILKPLVYSSLFDPADNLDLRLISEMGAVLFY